MLPGPYNTVLYTEKNAWIVFSIGTAKLEMILWG
jgi:hypothetical protein